MHYPVSDPKYQIPGLVLRMLTREDQQKVLDVRDAVMAALPNKRWYFPMEPWEVEEWLQTESLVGYFDGDVLAGFAGVTFAEKRWEHAYAQAVGEDAAHTADFHDVMVHPAYRGRHIHQHFLAMADEAVRAEGGGAIYATVDPENEPSWHNFEKDGYVCVITKPAYDGRPRRYYKHTL